MIPESSRTEDAAAAAAEALGAATLLPFRGVTRFDGGGEAEAPVLFRAGGALPAALLPGFAAAPPFPAAALAPAAAGLAPFALPLLAAAAVGEDHQGGRPAPAMTTPRAYKQLGHVLVRFGADRELLHHRVLVGTVAGEIDSTVSPSGVNGFTG